MKIGVRVIPNSKKNEIKKEETWLKVCLTATAHEGKANKALIGMLAGFFQVSKSRIRILKGFKSKNKIVEVSQ